MDVYGLSHQNLRRLLGRIRALSGKPGFANRCPTCSAPEETDSSSKDSGVADAEDRELNEARRRTIRDMLYRKES